MLRERLEVVLAVRCRTAGVRSYYTAEGPFDWSGRCDTARQLRRFFTESAQLALTMTSAGRSMIPGDACLDLDTLFLPRRPERVGVKSRGAKNLLARPLLCSFAAPWRVLRPWVPGQPAPRGRSGSSLEDRLCCGRDSLPGHSRMASLSALMAALAAAVLFCRGVCSRFQPHGY